MNDMNETYVYPNFRNIKSGDPPALPTPIFQPWNTEGEDFSNYFFYVVMPHPLKEGEFVPVLFPFGRGQQITLQGPYGSFDSIRFLAVPKDPMLEKDEREFDYYEVLDPADRRRVSEGLTEGDIYFFVKKITYETVMSTLENNENYKLYREMGQDLRRFIHLVLPPAQTPNQ